MNAQINIFFAICVTFATLYSVDALLCNTCIASTESDCREGVVASYVHQLCQPPVLKAGDNFEVLDSILASNVTRKVTRDEPIKAVCISFSILDTLPNVYQRGCGYIYASLDICDYLSELVTLGECSFCEGDFCNL